MPSERIEGYNEAIKGTGRADRRARRRHRPDPRPRNVEDALAANPEINCMVGFYSYNTPRIYEVLKDAGKLGQITVVGFDEDPITLGGVPRARSPARSCSSPIEWGIRACS